MGCKTLVINTQNQRGKKRTMHSRDKNGEARKVLRVIGLEARHDARKTEERLEGRKN